MAQAYMKVFFDWPEKTSALSFEEKGRLMDALVHYARGDLVGELNGNERILFPVFCWQLDRDTEKYKDTVTRNQENGRKGGRPRKNPENPVGFEKPKLTQKSQEEEKKKEEEDRINQKKRDITTEQLSRELPAREAPMPIDEHWRTSTAARRATAQVIADTIARENPSYRGCGTLYDVALHALELRVPPERIRAEARGQPLTHWIAGYMSREPDSCSMDWGA